VQGILSQVGEGFRALAGQREASLLVRLALAQTFTRGCLTVLLVVVAFDLLGTGAAGAGVLTAALGVGAVAGSVGALASVTGRRLATIQAVGVALWGVPLVLSGVFPNGVAILGFMCAIGVGNALVDLGLFTLLARLAPQHLMGRIFGALEGLIALMVALGALVTPLLIRIAGVRGALIAVGVVAPTLVAFVWPHLRHIDAFIVRRDDEIAMLKRVAMLQPLPLLAIENLALRTDRSHVAAGADVFQQGDSGDRFYIIHHGEADVIGDGRLIRVLGPGDCFGEVALLHDVRRTATVRARTDLDLCTLERDVFLSAVGDYSVSAREADGLARDRLDAFTPSTFPPA
jgi:MFS family permease